MFPWLVEGRFARGEISDGRLMDDGRALGKGASVRPAGTRHATNVEAYCTEPTRTVWSSRMETQRPV